MSARSLSWSEAREPDTPGEPATRRGVQSVERAMTLLMALGEAGRPLSAGELALKVSLPRPTVHRLVATLRAAGMVTPTDRGYAIGARVLWLAGRRLAQAELRAVGRRYLHDLRDKTRETVHMAVLEQGQVVYVDKVESSGPIRMASTIGGIVPAHCTALGKAMLAHVPIDEVTKILHRHGLPRRTPQTITDPKRLLADLEAIRARGYSIDNVENEEGIRCTGAAVFDHQGRVAGGISVSGAAHVVTMERIRRGLGPLVKETARLISQAMGWQESRVARR